MTGSPVRLPIRKQFAPALHCVHISTDGLVYICERGSDRVQVFTKQGQVRHQLLSSIPRRPLAVRNAAGPAARCSACAGPFTTSRFRTIRQQKYVFIADGTNDKIWIQDRKTGALAGSIGDNGRMAGQFHWIDGIAMDSHGNLYTGEVDTGKRVQKFVLTNGDGKVRPRPHE